MNQYLKHSIFWFVFAISLAWGGLSWGGDPRIRGNCVSESIINAEEWIRTTGREAQIIISNIEPGIDHAQAIGKDWHGGWVYLTRHESDGMLRRWHRHFPAKPYRYVDVETFVREQEKIE
jgi:hypothetical protein